MKIAVIGFSGSGKSTLAKKLGEMLHLPVLHLDSVNFFDNWQTRTPQQKEEMVQSFVQQHQNWVIDGNYSSTFPQRFEMTDLTVFLDINRISCFFAAWKRYRKYKGKCRPDLPCEEKFDREFRRWLLFEGRTKQRRSKLTQLLNKTSGQKVRLTNRRQIEKFLRTLVK